MSDNDVVLKTMTAEEALAQQPTRPLNGVNGGRPKTAHQLAIEALRIGQAVELSHEGLEHRSSKICLGFIGHLRVMNPLNLYRTWHTENGNLIVTCEARK